MPRDILGQATWADLLGAIAALALIGGAVLVIWKTIHPLMVKITHVLDVFLGRPGEQGIPAQPGVIERLEKIEQQVTPNHGSTKKLTEEVQDLQADVKDVQADVKDLRRRLEEHLQ